MRQPIHASTLSQFGTRTEMTAYLRRCTYGNDNF